MSPDPEEIVARILKCFPVAESWMEVFQPNSYMRRCIYRIGQLDITYDHERWEHYLDQRKNSIRVIRVTVWNRCDALIAADVFYESGKISLSLWQDEKVRDWLVPLIDQRLILDDLADA